MQFGIQALGEFVASFGEVFIQHNLTAMRFAKVIMNDFIIIRRQFTATDGDIVLVLIDDVTPMIKRLKRNQGRIGLFSEDDITKPLWYSSTRVSFQGIVVETRRNYKVGENPIA